MRIVIPANCRFGPLKFVATALLLLAILTGCGKDPETTSTISETDSSAGGGEYDCSDKLNSALDMVQPDRLGVSTDAETSVSRLNTWLEDCGPDADGTEPVSPDIKTLLEQVYSEAELNQLASDRFVTGDAEHLRNCMIHKELASLDFEKAESDLDNIVALFHFCMNNIALHASVEEQLPLTPNEILLFGRGTPEDAAWVFIDLLRQLQIDAVILRPNEPAGEDAKDKESPWLIGVLWNKQVYLFDPRLGTPIPGPADEGMSPTIRQPATLEEVVADDALLRKLDSATNGDYPFTSAQLSKVAVQVVGVRGLWSSAMRGLQANLSGERSAVIYDSLQDESNSPGLITRVANAGGERWANADVSIWPYPHQQMLAAGKRDEEQRQRLNYLKAPHDAPFSIEFDEVSQRDYLSKPGRRHFKTRVSHLLGHFDNAIRNYQTMRIRLMSSSKTPFPQEIQLIHQRATDDAAYWIGLCQFEQGKFEQAASTFRDYLSRYRDSAAAAWMPHARIMLALSVAETGNLDGANFELTRDELPGPLAARQRFLSERWKAAISE